MNMRLGVLVLLAMAGCVSDSGNSDILPNMIKEVAQAAVQGAMKSPPLYRYVERFRASHDGRNPVVKVGMIRSDVPRADEETLKEGLVRPFLMNLVRANLVDVSSHEGLLRTKSASGEATENATRGDESPRAADIVLGLDVKSSEEKRGDSVFHDIRFELRMDDIRRGKIIWKYSVPKGYACVKGRFF